MGRQLILTVLGKDPAYAGRYALGVLLGGAASVIKVPIMEGNINRTLDMPPGQAHIFNLIGAVLGVLSLQFAAYSLKFLKL